MQVWRWKTVPALVVLAGLICSVYPAVASAATPTIPTWTDPKPVVDKFVADQATRMATAAPDEAKVIREEVESVLAAPRGGAGVAPATFRGNLGDAVADKFGALLSSKSPHVSLNAIMLIANVRNISTDRALDGALGNANPAVRYWAARGLAWIMPDLNSIPAAAGRATDALAPVLAKESSPLVKAELVRALALSPATTANPSPAKIVIAQLNDLAKTFAASADITQLVAVTNMIDAATPLAATAKPPEDFIQPISDLMGLSASHLQVEVENGDAKAEGRAPAVFDLATAGTNFINAAAGKKVVVMHGSAGSKPIDIISEVKAITGGDATSGTLQKAFPKIKVPPKISAKPGT